MLQLLCWAKPSLIKAVLKRAFQDLINALSECSLNIFKGHVQLTPPQKQRLQFFRKCKLYTLNSAKVNET